MDTPTVPVPIIDSFDSGFIVKNFVIRNDSSLAFKLRGDLVKEYSVSTTSEKMIIDLVVTAYIRYLECSRLYSSLLEPVTKNSYDEDEDDEEGETWTYTYNQLKTNTIKELGKQIGMAHQQYITSLTFLKELKRPSINVNIKTKQAFVAENQQFNKNA